MLFGNVKKKKPQHLNSDVHTWQLEHAPQTLTHRSAEVKLLSAFSWVLSISSMFCEWEVKWMLKIFKDSHTTVQTGSATDRHMEPPTIVWTFIHSFFFSPPHLLIQNIHWSSWVLSNSVCEILQNVVRPHPFCSFHFTPPFLTNMSDWFGLTTKRCFL